MSSTPQLIWASRRGAVAVVAAIGPLQEVVGDLRRGVLLALAEDPKAVVCDLTGVVDGSDADARSLLATVGPQLHDWPAVPLAMPCPDPVLRRRLRRAPMSEYVLLRLTLAQGLTAVGHSIPPTTARLALAPHATASRLARDFVSRTCLDWGLVQGIAAACLVVSELVTHAQRHGVAEMDLSVARQGAALRLALRQHGDQPWPERSRDVDGVQGRGLAVVAACSRAWGVLPTADGGTVVWAVLDV